ncbi:hypothetical protein D3C87_1887650 [compost metagenome]
MLHRQEGRGQLAGLAGDLVGGGFQFLGDDDEAASGRADAGGAEPRIHADQHDVADDVRERGDGLFELVEQAGQRRGDLVDDAARRVAFADQIGRLGEFGLQLL